MSAARAPGIRSRLATLVLASTLPALLLVVGLLGLEHSRERELLEHDSIAVARAMAHAIDREIVTISSAAQVLATSQRARAGDLAGFYLQAEEVVSLGLGLNVVLSTADGQQLLNTLRPRGAPLPRHGNPAQLRKVFETGRPVVSDLYTGGVLGRPVLSIDVPVMRDGRVVYDLSIGERPERFASILLQQNLPPGWIGAVFDTNGAIVARTHGHQRFVGSKGAPALVARMALVEEGALETDTVEGTPVVSAFSRSSESGWTVALGIPREQLDAALWRRTGIAAMAAAATLALGLGLAWSIGGSIAKSIRALAGPAARLATRERVTVPPLGLAEADEVGRALAGAAELISSAEHRAQHDPLTGLANRELFRETAVRQLELSRRHGLRLAVLYVDLDGFKQVNDRYGHDAGDRLLADVATRLRGALRGSDLAARLGGDEFAVLLADADGMRAAAVAAKLVDVLAAPYAFEDGEREVSASIGVAAYPEEGASVEDLLRHADEAMYRAKVAGRRRYAVSSTA